MTPEVARGCAGPPRRSTRTTTTTTTVRPRPSTASWLAMTWSSCSSRWTAGTWRRRCRCSPVWPRPGRPSRKTSSTSGGWRTDRSSSSGPAATTSACSRRSAAGRVPA